MSPPLDFSHVFVPGSSGRTLLLLHGTGGSEHDLIPLGRSLDPTANLLSPRGKVLENGMPRFFRRLKLKQPPKETVDSMKVWLGKDTQTKSAEQGLFIPAVNGTAAAIQDLLMKAIVQEIDKSPCGPTLSGCRGSGRPTITWESPPAGASGRCWATRPSSPA
jgi:hypothetical protein